MKPDERVSDERLGEKIRDSANAIAAANIMFPEVETILGEETLSLLRELQDRRAAEQAELPAVEEMAETILYRLEDRMKRLSDESDYLRIIKSVITPLYAKLADLEQQLSRNQQFCADQRQAIAERDAVLGECRVIVQERRDAWTIINDSFRTERAILERDDAVEQCDSLLNRIDALLGAKGETG